MALERELLRGGLPGCGLVQSPLNAGSFSPLAAITVQIARSTEEMMKRSFVRLTNFVRWSGLIASGCFLFLLTSCSKDPVKEREKFLASGKQYMSQHRYREAEIELRNAL